MHKDMRYIDIIKIIELLILITDKFPNMNKNMQNLLENKIKKYIDLL